MGFVVSAFLDGGSSEPEIEVHIEDSPIRDEGYTFLRIERPGWGTLAGLLLDEMQVGELIAALQRRRHIMPARGGTCDVCGAVWPAPHAGFCGSR